MVSSVIYLCLSVFCFAPCRLLPQAGSFTSFQVGSLSRKRAHPFQQCRLMLTGPDQPHLMICPSLTLSLKLSYSLPWDWSVLLPWILLMQALLLTHSPILYHGMGQSFCLGPFSCRLSYLLLSLASCQVSKSSPERNHMLPSTLSYTSLP